MSSLQTPLPPQSLWEAMPHSRDGGARAGHTGGAAVDGLHVHDVVAAADLIYTVVGGDVVGVVLAVEVDLEGTTHGAAGGITVVVDVANTVGGIGGV